MGILRLLLAFSVLSSHSQELRLFFFGPGQSVLSFFIISGFYMALILDGKYTSKISFYISRALRIFPIYWLVLLFTIFLGLIKIPLHVGSEENSIIHYLMYSKHLTKSDFVTETVNYISRNLTLIITKDYFGVRENIAAGYLVLYQGWSLQIELLFYLVSPFILLLRKNVFAFTVFYATLIYGIVLPFSHFSENNLTLKFAGYLFYFLLGICSYKYIFKIIENAKPTKTYVVLFITTILYISFYQIIPGKILNYPFYINIYYYIYFATVIPYIFSLTKNNRFDRFLGDLSYPVYISHLIFVKTLLSFPHPHIPLFNTLFVAATTIIFSIIVVKYFQEPIDRFRYKITEARR